LNARSELVVLEFPEFLENFLTKSTNFGSFILYLLI
jgi:hypothetical protein